MTGSDSYLVYEKYDARPDGVVLSRFKGTSSDEDDAPTAMGVTLSDTVGDLVGRPVMAFLGEPLYAMMQNLGQTDNSFRIGRRHQPRAVARIHNRFPAGSYGLLGVGVNIEGSADSNGVPQLPKDATSVAVPSTPTRAGGRARSYLTWSAPPNTQRATAFSRPLPEPPSTPTPPTCWSGPTSEATRTGCSGPRATTRMRAPTQAPASPTCSTRAPTWPA